MVSGMNGIHAFRAALAAAALAILSGCVPALIAGTGAVVGTGVAQERTTRDALDDIETETSINNALLNESGSLFRRVSVEADEGRVLLTGSVPSPQESIRATEIAWAAPGTREVINELEIAERGNASAFAEDLWITTQLRSRLLGDPQIASINYSIEAYDGVVHLIGIARSQAELERATGHAAAVPGVRQVVSHVLLIDDPRRKSV